MIWRRNISFPWFVAIFSNTGPREIDSFLYQRGWSILANWSLILIDVKHEKIKTTLALLITLAGFLDGVRFSGILSDSQQTPPIRSCHYKVLPQITQLQHEVETRENLSVIFCHLSAPHRQIRPGSEKIGSNFARPSNVNNARPMMCR